MNRDNSKLVVIVDGRRLTPQATGVGRYLSLLLDYWAVHESGLKFVPKIIQHQSRPLELDPWKSLYPHDVRGRHLPGWIWENLSLATHENRSLPLFAPANLVPYRWRGPVVLVVHDTFCERPESGIKWRSRLRFRGRYRRSAQRADMILVPSRATADDVNRFFNVPHHKIHVVRPGIPCRFKPANHSEQGVSEDLACLGVQRPFLLFVGKKASRRRFDQILQAVANLRRTGHDIQLVSIGPDSTRYPAQDGWLDLGHVPDRLLIELYQTALALVWPSSVEGFGLPVAEAQACGCPVITTNSGAIREILGDHCIPLNNADSLEIERAILRLLTDSNFMEQLKTQMRDRSDLFRVKPFADQVANLIGQFL